MILRVFIFTLIGLMGWSGCGRERGSRKTREAAEYGGTLVYGKSGPPLTLDAAQTQETESSIIVANIFDALVEQRAGKVALDPGLARSWDISQNGLLYTFHLRSEVTFHDGTPFNAEAVLFNYNRQRDPNHPYYKMAPKWEWDAFDMSKIVKDIRAEDDTTVTFELYSPNATFLNLMSLTFMGIPSPTAVKQFGEDFSRHPVGTGPFKFQSWSENGEVLLTAFEEHWAGRPFVDTLIFKPVPDGRERWQQLKRGDINMMGVPDQADLMEIEQTKGIKVAKQPGLNVSYLAMNMEKKPFSDTRVREAIVHAIDREKLVKQVFSTLGRSAKNPIPPSLLGYNDAIRATRYDPDRARRLLAEAGYPKGFKCSLWTMKVSREYMPNGKLAAEVIQEDLRKIGIETEIVMPEWGDFLRRRSMGEHDMSISGWLGDAPDPHFFFYPLLDKSIAEKKPSSNAAFYKSDRMHDLIVSGKETFDPVERSNIYKQACEVFNEDLPWFVIAHGVSVVPMADYVMGFQMHASAVRKFHKVWLNRKS